MGKIFTVLLAMAALIIIGLSLIHSKDNESMFAALNSVVFLILIIIMKLKDKKEDREFREKYQKKEDEIEN